MLEHSKTTPEPEEQCHICGNWLKHQKGLRKHIARHHDDFVDCPICKKRIQNKQALNGHMRSAHGERTHQCTLCDKAFKTRLILKEHIASHTGVDLYKCQYCPKTFKSSANLYSHRKKMHFDEWNRDYPKRCVKLAKTSNIECTDV
ncbi:Transcription factor grauzone [Pseudolycoriella hygida]|uniref:Transcription factor grauzone n=1 Tax=Pseudolycoriella hygida TaxID=35572 RepID=A0A9Q0S0F1_9DIPT|nr:Transcription factor grauzone [Pseudolycoriella hygida]